MDGHANRHAPRTRRGPARAAIAALITGAAALLPAAQARAQCTIELLPTGGAGQGNFGTSIAVSADGETAMIGAEEDGGLIGAAYAFVRSGANWVQQGPKLVPSGGVGPFQRFGHAVSLSADGNTAIVGAFTDSAGSGAAYVFTRSGGAWTQQGPKLIGNGPGGYFGRSVCLDAAGETAIVGAPSGNGPVSTAYVFTSTGGSWAPQGPPLTPTGGVGLMEFGCSVSLSMDGGTALVGATQDNNSVGAAFVFVRSGGVWTQQGPKLTPTGGIPGGGTGGGKFGRSVCLSADGNTAFVGADYDDNYIGAAYAFTRTGGVWEQQGPKIVPAGGTGNAHFGCSVSLGADGNAALVGAYGDSGYTGAAYVFARSGGVWSQKRRLVPTIWGSFGYSVALGSHTGFVGMPGSYGQAGSARAYDLPCLLCYPDCNADGSLTVADFGCFQTKFVAADPYADCNGDGQRTVADFGCFQTEFVVGCP